MPLARPPVHVPSPGAVVTSLWHFEPALSAALAVVALGYGAALVAARRRGRPAVGRWHAGAFYAGLAALTTALAGPLDAFNDDLFVAHMAQHLVLMQLAAPLLVLGRPAHVLVRGLPPRRVAGALRATIGRRWLRRCLDALCHPVVVAVLWNASLFAWHVPRLYEAALARPFVHDLEHVAFFGTSLLFWWVVVDPVPSHHRASDHDAIGMAFANCMGGGLVATALLFSPRVLYPSYLAAAAADRPWGLDPLADQRLGGLIMWLTGGLFLATIFRVVWRGRLVDPPPAVSGSPTGSR